MRLSRQQARASYNWDRRPSHKHLSQVATLWRGCFGPAPVGDQPFILPSQVTGNGSDVLIRQHQAELVDNLTIEDVLAHILRNASVGATHSAGELRILGDA